MKRKRYKIITLNNGPLCGQQIREITYQTLNMTFNIEGIKVTGYYNRLGNWREISSQ